jgi:hypothetical protein
MMDIGNKEKCEDGYREKCMKKCMHCLTVLEHSPTLDSIHRNSSTLTFVNGQGIPGLGFPILPLHCAKMHVGLHVKCWSLSDFIKN